MYNRNYGGLDYPEACSGQAVRIPLHQTKKHP